MALIITDDNEHIQSLEIVINNIIIKSNNLCNILLF